MKPIICGEKTCIITTILILVVTILLVFKIIVSEFVVLEGKTGIDFFALILL